MDLFKRIKDLSAIYDDDGPSATVQESRPMFNGGGKVYQTKGGVTLSTQKNVKDGFIYPVKNQKGEVRWRKTSGGEKRKTNYDFTKKAPISEMNSPRFKFDIDKNAWVYLGRSKDKDDKVLVKKKDETFKQFIKRKESNRAETMEKSRNKKISNMVSTKNKIDDWTKNWLDTNLPKKEYGIRNKNQFINKLKKDYKKFVNKDLKTDSVSGVSVYSKDKLPNISRSISEQLSPFEYEGFKTINVGKLGGTSKRNPVKNMDNEPFFKKIFFKNKVENTKGFKEDLTKYFDYITTNKRTAIGRETTKNFVPNKDVIYFLDSQKSGVSDKIKGDIMSSLDDITKNKYDAYQYRVRAGLQWVKNAETIEKVLGPKEMIKLTGFPTIKKGMDNESKQLKKIFDFTTELPKDLKLSYAIDHGQGISGAAKSGDKNLMRLAVTDLIGTTVETNDYLGRGKKGEMSFERQRNLLTNKIRKGEDVSSNITKLNNLVEKNYGKKDAYKIEKGKLVSSPISSASTAEERYKQYFTELNKKPEGKAAIDKKFGSLENVLNTIPKPDQIRLAKIGCPGKANGGRIGFNEGLNVAACATRGVEKLQGDPGKLTPGDQANVRALSKSGKALKFLKGALGPGAIIGEVLFEGGAAANKFMDQGVPIKQALGESYINKYLLGPKSQIDVEAERAKEFAKGEDFAMAERGRRMAPFMPQSATADAQRLKKREEQMEQVYPTMSIPDINLALENVGLTQQETGMSYPELQDYIKREDQMQAIADVGGVANLAGGGIAKMAGDRSGAMTKSMNPDSQGLSYLFNRVKKVQE